MDKCSKMVSDSELQIIVHRCSQKLNGLTNASVTQHITCEYIKSSNGFPWIKM